MQNCEKMRLKMSLLYDLYWFVFSKNRLSGPDLINDTYIETNN